MLINDKKNITVGGVIIMHKNHNNYGTSLQGFATIDIVRELGYNLRIIRYNKKRTLKELIINTPFLLLSGALNTIIRSLKRKTHLKLNHNYSKNIVIRTNKVNQFKKTYFEPISDYYTGYKHLSESSKNYDVVFVGSDQVWGPLSLYSKFYNLLFVDPSIPKFSYASSFGISNVLPWQKKGTAKYLNQLDKVGVREIQGKIIVESLSNNKATVVLDPTLLLTVERWQELAKKSTHSIESPYIFTYILGKREDTRNTVKELSNKTGYPIVSMNHIDDYLSVDVGFGDTTPYDVDAFDFIKLLSNATYVCTDSFHGTIFSLLFHKQFMTFYRHKQISSKSTESRIDSLLSVFNCESRLFNFDGQEITKSMDEPIDYDFFEEKLKKMREESLKFLKTGLELSEKGKKDEKS